MEENDREFLESLREEVIHHKEKRATFVLRKLAFVAALFGLGSIESEWAIKFHWLLFAVPFISLAFDTYISAEDYKVKRIGTFCRIYRYATSCERSWERFVNQHREPIAVWASLVLTVIAIVASALVLCVQNSAVRGSGLTACQCGFSGFGYPLSLCSRLLSLHIIRGFYESYPDLTC